MPTFDPSSFLESLRRTLSAGAVLTGGDIPEHHHADWSGAGAVAPLAVARPNGTEEVAAVLRLCNAHGVPVVPHGGLTGLSGAAQPVARGIVLSLARLDRIEQIDPAASTVTVQAGVILQRLQEALAGHHLQFGVDLAPRGTCQIGGLLACNAGGLNVIQHGAARAQVIGLECVLPGGDVLPLRALQKNCTGYDLAQWFIGSEGTLGVITRAVLKAVPLPTARKTACLALSGVDGALDLLARLRQRLPQQIAAFEIMWDDFLGAAKRWVPVPQPFDPIPPLTALIDVTGNDEAAIGQALEDALGEGIESGWIDDAVIATSLAQAAQLWQLRDCMAELWTHMKPVNFDLSVPVPRIGEFRAAVQAALARRWPDHRAYYFGHIGDGNLHIIVDAAVLPAGTTAYDVEAVVFAELPPFAGSISAEHGVGTLKKPFLGISRGAAEIDAMRAVKRALDPNGIMNPGKIFD
ncbi:MAG: FAD-binding oxidoreductase [Candidatus Accumulibacter sp.]|jgi:FAD/FMN-containing dehydrogenase|nr:FAD-binding oxidoreductase [Accumulibacter sp.]